MPGLIDWQSPAVALVLNTLLKDRTTGKNIIFATDAYEGVDFHTLITKKMLLEGTVDIRPRVEKSLEEQTACTRKKAEVFTPSWLCNKMNNHCDTEWFGRVDVFNIEEGQQWRPTAESITFPGGKTWKDYVLSKRLEITCGEAPYLVSRYDAATGETIPVAHRIGILDRKLRVVGENTQSRRTWTAWAYRAFESSYGYEYQGDNLLIARVNLLETFCDYVRQRWQDEPTDAELKRIATIISWNLWQMDGIHGTVPFAWAAQEREDALPHQLTMFGGFGEQAESAAPAEQQTAALACQIYDWVEDRAITYQTLGGGNGQ